MKEKRNALTILCDMGLSVCVESIGTDYRAYIRSSPLKPEDTIITDSCASTDSALKVLLKMVQQKGDRRQEPAFTLNLSEA